MPRHTINFRRTNRTGIASRNNGGISRRAGMFDQINMYDLLVPPVMSYNVTFNVSGNVPHRLMNGRVTRHGVMPDLNSLVAEAFVHCFEIDAPERGIRRNFRVRLEHTGDSSDSGSDSEDGTLGFVLPHD
jgi:hypothetical protein